MKSVLILGRRKQGKSTLSLMLAMSYRDRVLIFDPNHQFDSVGFQTRTVEEVHQAIVENREAVIVFSPVSDPVQQFENWADMIWEHWRDLPMSIVVDESALLQRAHFANSKLERFIRQSPATMAVLQSTHRLADVAMVARQLMSDVYFFFTRNVADLERIERDFDEVGPEIAQAMAGLGEYQVIHVWLVSGGYYRWNIWEPECFYVQITERETKAA